MKSKISFFNAGISKNLLRRCWPLWAAYLAMLILILPVALANRTPWVESGYEENLFRCVLDSAGQTVIISGFLGVFAAMAMFGFLYNSRACGMMNALPVRRETMFLTSFITGLAPLLLADVLVAFASWAIFAPGGLVSLRVILIWLAAAAMGNTAFFGFAVFCAMLTGNIIVLPVVYAVLNLAVWAAESCVRMLLECFVYGVSNSGTTLDWFSPPKKLLSEMYTYVEMNGGPWRLGGLDCLGVYCAAGLALAGLALLLYRRRQMERASDVVAVPVLRPVFKYCLACGTAVVFAAVVYDGFFFNSFQGMAAALLIMVLLLIGAFIGYFAAEMLMQKSVRVFSGKWKGYIVLCAILATLTMCFELDFFGVETRVPAAADVEFVDLMGEKLREPENIEKVTELHRQIISHKNENEAADKRGGSFRIYLRYFLRDGRELYRSYNVPANEEARNSVTSDLGRYMGLVNVQEIIDNRIKTEIPITEDTVSSFYIEWHVYDEQGNYESSSVRLTPAQGLDFYENCLMPDAAEGRMGRFWPLSNENYYATASNVVIYFDLIDRSMLLSGEREEPRMECRSFTLNMDAARCLAWIRENTDIEPLPIGEADRSILEKAELGKAYAAEAAAWH